MKLKDLYEAIKLLNESHYYHYLNDFNYIETYVLRYSIGNGIWQYYYLNEKGGKGQLKTFSSREQACEYALRMAIKLMRGYNDSITNMIEREYLGKPYPQSRQAMELCQIFDAINILGSDKEKYANDPHQDISNYNSRYNQEKKKWEYTLSIQANNQSEDVIFDTEEQAREYVINGAIKTIREFGDAWINAVKQENK